MSKLNSRKLWIVIWAMLTFSILAVVSVVAKFEASWMAGSMLILVSIPGAYVGIGTAKKKAE
jgi:hypothetical protein